MKKVINLAVMVTILMSVLSVSAKSSPREIEAISNLINTNKSNSSGEMLKTGKSAVGMNMMITAIDLRTAKFYVAAAIADPTYLEDAIDNMVNLTVGLEGTKEGRKLMELAGNKNKTLYDFYRVIGEVEQSLRQRLNGEALWAFKVGYSLIEVLVNSEAGKIQSVRTPLAELPALIAEGGKYASAGEIQYLVNIAEIAEGNQFTKADKDTLKLSIAGFLDSYFPKS